MNLGNAVLQMTDADFRRMGYQDKADYERQHRRTGPRYKGEMAVDTAPTKKVAAPDQLGMKGNDYKDKQDKSWHS